MFDFPAKKLKQGFLARTVTVVVGCSVVATATLRVRNPEE
jgi:hypothetical protein